jgi:N-acyl-phosphatidylethanolamine-hydrolysing phospholipase D
MVAWDWNSIMLHLRAINLRASASGFLSRARILNPWPNSSPHGFGSLLRWTRERAVRRLRGDRVAERSPLAVGPSAVIHPRQGDGALRATWVGHSTVLLQIGATNVLTDPIWSERASPIGWAGPKRLVPPAIPLSSLPPIDVVLISHDHYDHLDESTVRALASAHPGARWVAPLGVGALLTAFGVAQVVELDWWQSAAAADATVTAVPAQHFSGRSLTGRDRTLWCGFAVAAAGWRVLFGGDTGYHPEFNQIGRALGPFDLALLPVGAYDPRWFMRPVHMDPEEAVAAAVDLGRGAGAEAPILLATHWGTFRLTDEPMDEPPRRTINAWAARNLPPDRCWVLREDRTRRLAPRPVGRA